MDFYYCSYHFDRCNFLEPSRPQGRASSSGMVGNCTGGQSVKSRDIVTEKMTPAQLFEAQKPARERKPKKGGAGSLDDATTVKLPTQ